MKSKKSIALLYIFCVGFLFSQELEQDDSQVIAVPDVSTAIGGEDASIDEGAIPDFTLVLPEVETDYLLTLDLPEVAETTNENSETSEAQNYFSLEGVVGGGFPGYFLGDIRISQYSDTNPFNVNFSHVSKNGFGAHSASDGYTKSSTLLSGKALMLMSEMYSFEVEGSYIQGATGLQNKSPLFYQSANTGLEGIATFSVIFPSQWNINFHAGGEWANRYLGRLTQNTLGKQSSGTFSRIDAGFSFGKSATALDFSVITDYNYSILDSSQSHRFSLNSNIQSQVTENFFIKGDFGVIYEENLNAPVLLPFSLLVDYALPNIALDFSAGMKSAQVDYAYLQKRYPFSDFPKTNHEESAWFALLNATIPLLKNSVLNTTVKFENTAFNQGVYLPVYEDNSQDINSGLYAMQITDMLILDTDVSFGVNKGIFGFLAGWNASWIDVLPEENTHEVFVSASVISNDDTIGAQLSVTEAFFEDYTPIVDLKTFMRVTPEIQIELQISDLAKLVTGNDRSYAGEYVTDTGFIGLFVHLYL